LKDGVLYGSVFSAENSANYLAKVIEVTNEMELPVSLGSDDGIKVFLNGEIVLAKNIGRGAAPDQDKVVLKLKKGKNTIILKFIMGVGLPVFILNPVLVSRNYQGLLGARKYLPVVLFSLFRGNLL
jgi:hypothetical protein